MNAPPEISIKGSASIAGRALFAHISHTLRSGEWTCLLGTSGIGKTTILRLIAELEVTAEFVGTIRASDGKAVADRVAYMAQRDLLLPWATIRQNVALGATLRSETPDEARITTLLNNVGLDGHGDKKPHQLSGGERQRAALARTLMEDKEIILLDEPFSALDARTRADMQELACHLLSDRTVLLVTHDPAEAARLGNSILVMTEQGFTEIAPPHGSIPRDVDDPGLLAAQAELLNMLRGRSR